MNQLREDLTIAQFIDDYDSLKGVTKARNDIRNLLLGAFPDYLRQIRRQANRMTQEELATRLGVDHSYISKLENGAQAPSDEFLEKLRQFISDWDENV